METNKRRQVILDHLLARRGFVTSEEIAAYLGVSVRTVYRDIAAINRKAHVIYNIPSKGMQLDYKAYLAAAAQLREDAVSQGPTIRERRHAILLLLLLASPTGYSISRLSEIFYVAQSSIQQDLKRVAEEVKGRYALRVQPSPSGTAAHGSEQAIRNALMEQASDLPGMLSAMDAGEPAGQRYVLDVLRSQGFVPPGLISVISRAIHQVESQFGLRIENPDYDHLLLYLLITVERARHAHSSGDAALPPRPEHRADGSPGSLSGVPNALIEEISGSLQLDLPASEARPLHAFLFRTWPEGAVAKPTVGVESPVVIGKRLIELVSKDLGVDLTTDEELLEKLMQHLEPMLSAPSTECRYRTRCWVRSNRSSVRCTGRCCAHCRPARPNSGCGT